MLKKVVLPAPLGPMIETIERGLTLKETSSTATRPPKALVTCSVASSASAEPLPALMTRASMDLPAAPRARPRRCRQLELAPALRQQALGSQHHHQHEQEAEHPEGDLGEGEVEPERVELALDELAVEHVGDEPVVEEAERDRAEHHPPDAAQPAEDDHREDEDREAELELVGVDAVVEGAEERARDAAEGAARGVGEQLGLDERHAHAGRGDLVLAQRDPGAAEARVAQPEVHEQHHEHEREHAPVVRAAGRSRSRTRRRSAG